MKNLKFIGILNFKLSPSVQNFNALCNFIRFFTQKSKKFKIDGMMISPQKLQLKRVKICSRSFVKFSKIYIDYANKEIDENLMVEREWMHHNIPAKLSHFTCSNTIFVCGRILNVLIVQDLEHFAYQTHIISWSFYFLNLDPLFIAPNHSLQI